MRYWTFPSQSSCPIVGSLQATMRLLQGLVGLPAFLTQNAAAFVFPVLSLASSFSVLSLILRASSLSLKLCPYHTATFPTETKRLANLTQKLKTNISMASFSPRFPLLGSC